MKYKTNKKLKLSIFALLLSTVFSAQAFNLEDYFSQGSNEEAKDEVTQPVAKPQQAESYKMGRKMQYSNWILQCIEAQSTGNEQCNLIHQINNQDNRQILKVELLKSNNNKLMLFHVPLGTYLPAGAKLMVGEQEYSMPITTCLATGCQAKIEVDWNLNQKLKREEKAVVQLLHINQQQKINIEFSLMGYSKGSKEIK